MLNLKEYRNTSAVLSDYLPWAALIAPGIILNKDGSLQRTIRYRGPDLDSSTPSELVATIARVNNILRRFGAGWAIFMEAQRRPARDYPATSFADIASWLIDEERRQAFEREEVHFESRYFLTFVYLPPGDRINKAADFILEKDHDRSSSQGRYHDHLAYFLTQTNRALELLETLFPEVQELSDEQTLTYLHDTVSTKQHRIKVPDEPCYLDGVLTDSPFSGGLSPCLGGHHLRTATVLGFPNATTPGILDELNDLQLSYRWVTRWIPFDKSEAEKILKRIRRQWFVKRKSAWTVLQEVMFNRDSPLVDSDADNKAADADEALQELGSDDVSYGAVTATVSIMHPDIIRAEDQILQVERVINARGFVTIRETLNAVEAWLGSIPGHVYANIRRPIVHSINLAHMMPVSDLWAGPQQNSHLQGPPLVMAKTKGATPFRLNLHVGDVGHTLVVGPTGAGKSVLLSLLALQFRKYPNAQIFFFDKGKSAKAAVLAMGGQSFEPGATEQVCFQPLRRIDQPGEAGFALQWLVDCLGQEGVAMTPEVKQALWSALTSLASAPQNERTLTGLSLLLQSQDLRRALSSFTLQGAYGALLDADQDSLPMQDVLHFETETLLNLKPVVLPVLSYLFHKLEARFNGRPTLLVIDEAWTFLDNPAFAQRLREWLKTLRKKNVSVVFATQSLADIGTSSIAPTLIESCPTRIFLPNTRAMEPQIYQIYEEFGLNDRQITLISQSIPKCEYYLQSSLGNRLFELGLGPLAETLCGSSGPEDQALMDQILQSSPDNFLACFLRHKGRHHEADFVEKTRAKVDLYRMNKEAANVPV
ncbi:MAG: conjugal transfer protein TrbE [Methyloligellaceae bacterium]